MWLSLNLIFSNMFKIEDFFFYPHFPPILPYASWEKWMANSPICHVAFVKTSDTVYHLSWIMDKCSMPEVFTYNLFFKDVFKVTKTDFQFFNCVINRLVCKSWKLSLSSRGNSDILRIWKYREMFFKISNLPPLLPVPIFNRKIKVIR